MRYFKPFTCSRPGAIAQLLSAFVLLAGLVLQTGAAAQAQGMFAPARKVNDQIITNYEVAQRIIFLELLNVGSADMRQEALDLLTEEIVQMQYAQRQGVRVSNEDIREGMAEFAARLDLTVEQVLDVMAANGVEPETFRQFVRAGLLWRQVVSREVPALIHVSESDVARARDIIAIRGTTRVLISEIFLPSDPEFAEPVAQIMEMIEAARSVEEFSEIAREFSLAGSRDQGGRLEWLPIENLPSQIAGPISAARSGEVLGPFELGGAIAYFQLRALDSSRTIPRDRVQVTYKRLLLPGARSAANLARVAQIRAEVRACAELGRFARDLPEEFLVERTELMRNLPSSDAVELGRLDLNEISANTLEGNNLVVVMLCGREIQLQDGERPSDTQVSNILFDRRADALARVRLDELISDSDIRDF